MPRKILSPSIKIINLEREVKDIKAELLLQRSEKHKNNNGFHNQLNEIRSDIGSLTQSITKLTTTQEKYAEDHAYLREAVENNTKIMTELQTTIQQWKIVGKTTSSIGKILGKIFKWFLSVFGLFAIVKYHASEPMKSILEWFDK